jgi:RNA polymerase sigma-70 factor, ECF subfamily
MKASQETDFLVLLSTYEAIVYKVARAYAPTPEARKDLFQEIVVNLWKAYPSFRGLAKASTWFYQVALNTAITNFRREQRSVPLQALEALPFEPAVSSLEDSSQEEIHLLYQAIDRLSTLDKAIILLYLEEVPYREISQVLGISLANVGMRMMRAKEKLTTLLTKA